MKKIEKNYRWSSYGELLKSFMCFELKRNMFGVEFNGTNVWLYIRMHIIRYLLQQFFGIELLDGGVPIVPSYSGKKTFKIWYEKNIRQNSLLAGKRDILILGFQRKVPDGDLYYKDIITDELDKKLKRSHYILDVNPDQKKFIPHKSKNILRFDVLEYSDICGIQKNHNMISVDRFENEIIKPLEKEFGLSIAMGFKRRLLSYVNYYVFGSNILSVYCRFLLKRVNPKIVMGVDTPSAVAQKLYIEAKKLNIPTVELSHCIVGKNHAFHSFGEKMKIDGYPDYMFCFGEYDKQNVKWCLPDDKIYAVGFPFFESSIKKYIHKRKTVNGKKNIVFVSALFNEMIDISKNVKSLLPKDEYHIIYKLHPGEYNKWENQLRYFFEDTDIEVIHKNDFPIYYYYSTADWVIGIESTALYEATPFDLKIVVLTTREVGDRILIESGWAKGANDAKEIADIIIKDDFVPQKKLRIFENNALDKMEDTIEAIIKETENGA